MSCSGERLSDGTFSGCPSNCDITRQEFKEDPTLRDKKDDRLCDKCKHPVSSHPKGEPQKIEAGNPAEAIVDPIEAIKAKILKAVREVPLITNQVGWNALVNSGVITLDEMITITNHISESTSAPQPQGQSQGGDVDEIICNFWDAICNNRVKEDNGFLVLSSPANTVVAWGANYSNTEKLLVREEYKRIYNLLKERSKLKMVHLSGTKGIGKSMFLFWLIYQLVSSRPIGSSIPSILLIVGRNKTEYLLHNRNGNPEVRYWDRQQVDYVLSDVSYNLTAKHTRWSLLVSSYGATNPREYVKALQNSGVSGIQIVMGALKQHEIINLAPNKEVGEFSFLIFGGTARMLRAMSSHIIGAKVSLTSQRSDVEAIMREFLADSKYMDGSYDDLIKKSCDVICGQIDLDDSTVDAIKHSLFLHSFVELDENNQLQTTPTVASTFMEYYASFLREQHTADVFSGLRTMLTSAGIGNLFERHVLKTVVEKFKTRAQFEVKRMYPSGYNIAINDETEIQQLDVSFTRKVFIQTIEDIELLKDGELGIPSVTNFPVVDFVIKPLIEGQITVAKTHPCAYSRHNSIEDAMGGNRKDRKFIFFCDRSNFDGFRYDNKLANDVKQYKVLVEWTAKRRRPDADDLNVG